MSQTVLKKFSIIEDEDGTKLVVPSSWISLEQKHLWWPPYKDSQKIKKAAANCVEPSTKKNTNFIVLSNQKVNF